MLFILKPVRQLAGTPSKSYSPAQAGLFYFSFLFPFFTPFPEDFNKDFDLLFFIHYTLMNDIKVKC